MTRDGGNVLPFKARPVAKPPADAHTPPTCGPMMCEACRHEMISDVPCGRKYFPCPKCKVIALRRAGPVLPEDGVWRQSCPDCKGQTFAIMPNVFMCSDCGTTLKTDWTGIG